MKRLRELLPRSLTALIFSGLLLPACPALLDDDFETTPRGDASVAGSAGTLVDNDASDASGGSGGRDGSAGSSGSGGSAGSSGTAGSGGTNEAGPDAPTTCDAGCGDGLCCDGKCVDTQSDEKHCGACGAVCAGECCDGKCITNIQSNPLHCGGCGLGCAGTVCLNGQCSNECLFEYLDCDNNATTGCEVHAGTDSENCGSCAIACGFDATCGMGKCQCPTNTADCDNETNNGCEADLSSDEANCGGCRQNCGGNQRCEASRCVCEPGFADCNGKASDGCEASLSDPKTCGTCTQDCGANATCSQGTCGCSSDFSNCDAVAGCESPKTSPEHCGGCNRPCEGGTPVCNGTTCVSGCAPGETLCGSVSCVNLSNDPSNCGVCGRAVGPNQACVGGVPTCLPNFGNCNGLPGDGCEVDLRSDAAHCGSCPAACKPGAICANSACSCASGTPNDCGSACRECCDASQCSDGNACTVETCSAGGTCASSAPCPTGNKCCGGQGCYECCGTEDCLGGKVCSGNRCVEPACELPNVLCNGQCINPETNTTHCGGCNNTCTAGRTCQGRVCGPKWLPTPLPPAGFVARSRAAYAWTGSAVFIWGGASSATTELNTGAFYDPAQTGTAAWSLVPVTANTPTPRVLATAVWTGSSIVVWGGGDRESTQDYNSGSIYDPAMQTWTKMRTAGAPSARRGALGVWTGTRVLIWGGYDRDGNPEDHAYLYDPVTDTWSPVPGQNEPDPALYPATGWTGTQLYTFGGLENLGSSSDFRVYSAATNGWSAPATPTLTRRDGAFGGFDGTYFVVWGGRSLGTSVTTGFRHDPVALPAPIWASITTTDAPSARYAVTREHGWTARIAAGQLLLLGGFDPAAFQRTDASTRRDGAVYNSTTNTWTPVPAWPSGHARRFAVAVWMGSEFLLWGGESANVSANTGERLLP